MIVEIDDKSGFCFGVVRAIDLAESALLTHRHVCCLGDIVHNKMEVQRLNALGLNTIGAEDLDEDMACNQVLVRAHGEPPATYITAGKYGINIIDATCPVVAKLQKIVSEAYAMMTSVGGTVVILGKRGHAEVVGLLGQIDGNAVVVESLKEFLEVDFTRPIYLLSQTTQSLELLNTLSETLKEHTKDGTENIVNDTICRNVSNREPHLREFAKHYDVIIFVSGRKSSNGKVLFGQCAATNQRSYMIEDEEELREEWFENCTSVGICGATSTPKWLMERVAEAITNKKQ